MITADFKQEGGLPFEQNTLAFMQFAYGETLNALLGHLTNSNATHFIISGCEVQGTIITNGWLVINGELLYFDSANGNADSKIAANTELFEATFENGTEHEIYTIKTAVIDDTGVALNTFVRIPNVSEFLTSLPDATETIIGVAEIATQSEANGTTDDNRIITAKKLNERTATTTRRGVVELATNTETQTGTDSSRAITPANLESKTATETRKGIAEIATQTEANAGTDDTRMITPKKLVQAINDLVSLPPQATETVKGIAEIATQTGANGSTDDSRIITAKKLYNRTATTTRRGVAKIATQTEVNTGTDNTRIVTPSTLKNAGYAKTRIFGYVYLGNLPSSNPIASGDITSASAINLDGPDTRYRIRFSSIGTSQYTPIVYIESLHSNYNLDNDTIVSIKSIQSSSFDVLLREMETPSQNVRLRVQIII